MYLSTFLVYFQVIILFVMYIIYNINIVLNQLYAYNYVCFSTHQQKVKAHKLIVLLDSDYYFYCAYPMISTNKFLAVWSN